jgi:hypothetical protein
MSSFKPAFGLAAIALLSLTIAVACAGGGEEPPTVGPATPTPLATPTPIATVTPEVIDGVEVIPLQIGEESELPEDVALIIETGCYHCDGPTNGLVRVYRDASGEVRTDTLFTAATTGLQTDGSFIHSYALSSDASQIVVSVCTRGDCAWLGEASPDAQSTLYRSLDGGVTWEQFGVLDGESWVVAIAKAGVVVAGPYGTEEEPQPKYRLFASGEPVQPPPAARRWPIALSDGELTWPAENGRLLRSDGSQILAVSQSAWVGDVEADASAERFAVAWWTGVGIFTRDGRPITAFSLPGAARVGGWLNHTLVAGNVTVPPGLFPTPEAGRFWIDLLPAILDLEGGEAHPLTDPFLDPPFTGGRNYVQAVLPGPFARVVNTGACLNVRAEPGAAAAVLACAADGVLLRDTGEARQADGTTWQRVVTPAGVEGWASSQYLER